MKYNRREFRFNSRKAKRLLKYKANGIYLDVYNGRIVDQFSAEHIFPLKSAWEQGFKQMYAKDRDNTLVQMKRFANDPLNLVIVEAKSNHSRGHLTLWNWSPLNLAWIPERNRIVRQLAKDYGLKLTKPQEWAMKWADEKILVKYKYGIRLGKTRAWLLTHGFKIALPF